MVDAVLNEPGITKDVALRRAKAIMTIGHIFKSIEDDEDAEERRELERLVASAAGKKKKEKGDKKRKVHGSAPSTPPDEKPEPEIKA